MSSASVSGSASSRRPLVIALAVIGALFIILAILFFAGVPLGFLNSVGHSGKVNNGSHGVRGSVSAVIGVLALVGAWIANRRSSG